MWNCTKCREPVEESFEVCWNCGTARDGTEDPAFRKADDEPAPDPSAPVLQEAATTERPRQAPAPPRTRQVIVTTGNEVAGHMIAGYVGIVRGIVVRCPTIGQGFLGGLERLVGGNIESYAAVCETAREEAFERMVQHAEEKGADAVIAMRYDATEFADGVTEVLAYGTAVKLARN